MASSSKWSWEQNKLFEIALAANNNKDPDRFQKIAKITGKTEEEVKIHYQDLVHDVNAIDAGRIPLPNYKNGEAEARLQHEKTK